jgi:hypothetical protein
MGWRKYVCQNLMVTTLIIAETGGFEVDRFYYLIDQTKGNVNGLQRMNKAEQEFLKDLDKKLWSAADKLRNNLDAAVYKHVVLGLIFLKYVSDAFDERRQELREQFRDPNHDYYIPQEKLGELIDLFSDANFTAKEYKGKELEMSSKDILGHVYEYFLGQFALAEGKKGGQYYTPKSIVKLMVQMLQPFEGRVYDPAMGSGGFFVQSEKFIEEYGGKIGQISVWTGKQPHHMAPGSHEYGDPRHRFRLRQAACLQFYQRPAPRPPRRFCDGQSAL